MGPLDDFGAAVRRAARAAAAGQPAAARQTVIAADGRDVGRLAAALAALREALVAAGVVRSGIVALVVDAAPGPALPPVPGVTLLRHDPGSSPTFPAGRTPRGLEVELNDELREAEAVMLAGGLGAGEPPATLRRLLVPGLCSTRSASALRAAEAGERAAAAALLPADLVLGWRPDGAGGWEVVVG